MCAEKQNQRDWVPRTFIIQTIPSGTSEDRYGDTVFFFFFVSLCVSCVWWKVP